MNYKGYYPYKMQVYICKITERIMECLKALSWCIMDINTNTIYSIETGQTYIKK